MIGYFLFREIILSLNHFVINCFCLNPRPKFFGLQLVLGNNGLME